MKLLMSALLLFSISAFGRLPFQPTFTWTLPTQFTDDSPLVPSDLSEVKIYCAGASVVEISVPVGTTFTATVGMFVAGNYSCYFTSVANAANGGAESSASNPINFTVDQKSPNPVIDFDVI